MKSPLLVAVLLLAGCSDVNVPENVVSTDSTTQIDSVMRPGTAPVVDVDCARSLCGCWEDHTLAYENAVVDESTEAPLEGITLTCMGEDEPIATSDADGSVGFEIETRRSPGCGYERCRNLRFEDPTGAYEPIERTVFQSETIEMERIRED